MATLAARHRRASPPAEPAHGLALTYHRLMLMMLLFVGVTFVIVAPARPICSCSPTARRAAQLANPLLPPRGDIVDRNGVPLARTIDAWTIGVHPRADHRRPARARASGSHVLMPERSVADYRAAARRRCRLHLSRAARRARDGRGGERARRAGHRLQPRARAALSADRDGRPCARLDRPRGPWRRRHGAGARGRG